MSPLTSNEPQAWPRRFWWGMVILVFIGQLALIFIFGARKPGPVRLVTQAPSLYLVDLTPEFSALDDPTLFALPHANDFGGAERGRKPAISRPDFHWAEPAGWLPLADADLLDSFNRFMQTNLFATGTLDFKPPPIFSEPAPPDEDRPVPRSTFFLRGELAGHPLVNARQLTNSIASMEWPAVDVIAPSRVQVVVNTAGQVASAVLLPQDYIPDEGGDLETREALADQRALELARSAQFSPGGNIVVGQMIFNWHTVPIVPGTTNAPAKSK